MMDQQTTKSQIKSLQILESSLQKARKTQKTSADIFQLFDSNIPLQYKLQQLTNNMLHVIQCLQEAAPVVDKFSRKVAFYSRQRLVQNQGIKQIQGINKRTLISNNVNPNLGLLQHAVVEQIQIIDSEKKQTSTYQQINQALSTRIYYTNKTMDICIDYLRKNL